MRLSDHSHKSNHFLQTRVGSGSYDKICLQILNYKLGSVQLWNFTCVDIDHLHNESHKLQLSNNHKSFELIEYQIVNAYWYPITLPYTLL